MCICVYVYMCICLYASKNVSKYVTMSVCLFLEWSEKCSRTLGPCLRQLLCLFLYALVLLVILVFFIEKVNFLSKLWLRWYNSSESKRKKEKAKAKSVSESTRGYESEIILYLVRYTYDGMLSTGFRLIVPLTRVFTGCFIHKWSSQPIGTWPCPCLPSNMHVWFFRNGPRAEIEVARSPKIALKAGQSFGFIVQCSCTRCSRRFLSFPSH